VRARGSFMIFQIYITSDIRMCVKESIAIFVVIVVVTGAVNFRVTL
jgi:hypothetical protein